MNKNLLNELLDLTDEVADAVNLKLIALNAEHDEVTAQQGEAAQSAYEFIAKAKTQGLTNADLSKFAWAEKAKEAFLLRRENIERNIDALVALNHGEVRYNLARALNQGPLVREADPEFERLLAEGDPEYDALNIDEDSFADFRATVEAELGASEWVSVAVTPSEKAALLKAIAGWDGYDRETGETDYVAEDLLRDFAERLKATAFI